MSATAHAPMSADTFVAWAMDQPGRYELVRGDVVAMAPEWVGHSKAKFWLARRLAEAVEREGLECEVFPDGIAVQVTEDGVFEPCVTLRRGPPLPPNAVVVTDPMVIFEVRSPSTSRIDSGIKLSAYFGLPSMRHYLIADAVNRVMIHRHRQTDGSLLTTTVHSGPRRLDPPGIVLGPLWPG